MGTRHVWHVFITAYYSRNGGTLNVPYYPFIWADSTDPRGRTLGSAHEVRGVGDSYHDIKISPTSCLTVRLYTAYGFIMCFTR